MADRLGPGVSGTVAGGLEARLADLGGAIAWPAAPDLAVRVSHRLTAGSVPTRPDRGAWGTWGAWSGRPLRRSLLAAAALLLVIVAVAVAAGLLLPGLRIITLPPGATLPPVASQLPPGAASDGTLLGRRLGLGTATDLAGAEQLAGFAPLLPATPDVGPPDGVFVSAGRLGLVWRATRDLPETEVPGVGLVVTEFGGLIDEGWYEKLLFAGATTVEPVRVGGLDGYWVTGEPHALFYRDAEGRTVEETRRMVGDVLIWRQGDLTLRIESSLGQEATIALAETFRTGG